MGKRKDHIKVAEGLARGLSKREAVRQAGYSPMTAEKKAYVIVKSPLVQSALTDALERLGVTFDDLLKPVVEALKATLPARSVAGLRKTNFPDHRVRLAAHDLLVRLYGGVPRPSDIPPAPQKGLTVIISKEGGNEPVKQQNYSVDRTKIEPMGEPTRPAMPRVIISRETDS